MIFAMHDPLADLLGEWSRGLNTGSVLLRIALAVLLASVIGCERSSKRHSAGLRTFVLVSFASTVSMLLDVYLMSNFGARLPILSAATVIAAALRPWEGVIAADTGHINVHETGAIEASGHKVCAIEAPSGKLTPALVREVMRRHCDGQDEHMVLPRMVYISDATELGTIYTKAELAALHEVCGEYGLYLFLDGARMAAALVAEGNDLQPEDFATYCDVFYLGGTKNGLLFGEAVVITNEALKPHFRNMIKQRGGMFAKGFLFGTQFTAYLQDELWLTMARHAVTQAQRIQTAAVQKGYRLFAGSPTNQVFLVLSHAQIEQLRQDFAFEITGHVDDDHEAGRFVCSWATKEEAVDALIAAL